MNQKSRLSAAACAVAALTPLGLVIAHPDDPKVLDHRGPVIAEAFRAGDANAAMRGAMGDMFAAANVELLGWLPLSEFGADALRGSDCWGYTSPSGGEYAIMTVDNAVSFVDVTDPSMPVVIETFAEPASVWHDVKVYQDRVYSVTEGGGGIRVYDVSQIDSGVVTLSGQINDDAEGATHNVAIDEVSGFLYRCGGGPDQGLRIYDLSDLDAPARVGSWPDRYVHDAQVVTYTEGPYAGRQIAFLCSGFNGGSVDTGLTILDVTNKADLEVVAQFSYSTAAYSHQAWLSEDRQYLYLGDELDELNFGQATSTRIIDVSNIEEPVEVDSFSNSLASIDHNQYTHNGLLYQANYRSGLRIWDISGDPETPVEIGFFDTFPEDDARAFNGAWSVYPFFESGTIVVSDIERGLFVLRFVAPELDIAIASDAPGDLVDNRGQSFTVSITEVNGGELDLASPTLNVDTGDGFEEFPLEVVRSGDYTATLPAVECGTQLRYFISAQTTSGRIASLPLGAPVAPALSALAADQRITEIADNLETDTGWTAGLPEDTAIRGEWTRAEPLGEYPGEPDEDNPAGEGTFAYITGASTESNPFDFVRDGFVTLISPSLDATVGPAPTVRYVRWLVGVPEGSSDTTFFDVSVSNDGGATWVPVSTETASQFGAWEPRSFRINEFVTPTTDVLVRFVCTSPTFGEAGLDDFELITLECSADQLPGDANDDCSVDLMDLNLVLANFGSTNDAGDVTGDGSVDLADLNAVLGAFGDTCE